LDPCTETDWQGGPRDDISSVRPPGREEDPPVLLAPPKEAEGRRHASFFGNDDGFKVTDRNRGRRHSGRSDGHGLRGVFAADPSTGTGGKKGPTSTSPTTRNDPGTRHSSFSTNGDGPFATPPLDLGGAYGIAEGRTQAGIGAQSTPRWTIGTGDGRPPPRMSVTNSPEKRVQHGFYRPKCSPPGTFVDGQPRGPPWFGW